MLQQLKITFLVAFGSDSSHKSKLCSSVPLKAVEENNIISTAPLPNMQNESVHIHGIHGDETVCIHALLRLELCTFAEDLE
jgi:hypothetical protein